MYLVQWNRTIYKYSQKNVSFTFNAKYLRRERCLTRETLAKLDHEHFWQPSLAWKKIFLQTLTVKDSPVHIQTQHWISRHSQATRQLPNSLLRRIKQHGLCSVVHLRSGRMHIDGQDVPLYPCVFKNSALPVSCDIAVSWHRY